MLIMGFKVGIEGKRGQIDPAALKEQREEKNQALKRRQTSLAEFWGRMRMLLPQQDKVQRLKWVKPKGCVWEWC